MKKKIILFLIPILSLMFVITGCGKNANELAAEKILENSLGQDVNVDIDKKSVDIEIDQGHWQSGEGSQLPESWPDDVYVPEGQIVTASDMGFSKGLSLELDKDILDLRDQYKDKILEAGWQISMELTTEQGVILGANKDNRNLSVSISQEDGATTMIITLNEE